MARKVIDYDVIHDQTREGIVRKFRQKLTLGWQPQGGICHSPVRRDAGQVVSPGFTQAMVKYAPKKVKREIVPNQDLPHESSL